MGVAEEDIGDDVRGIAGDDLIEVVCGVGERVRAIPAREDVAEDPNALDVVTVGLQKLGLKLEQSKGTLLQYNNVIMQEDMIPYERKWLAKSK